MKIALISPFPDLYSFGLRSISAYLKQEGHDVELYFIQKSLYGGSMAGYPSKGYASVALTEEETKQALRQLVQLTKRAELIGISVMSNFVDEVIQITQALKKNHCGPILWGGIHPTMMPEESLEYADMICVGEGEEAVLELANKMESGQIPNDVRNIWVKGESGIFRNDYRHLTQNLNIFPPQDYDYESHYILCDEGVVKMTKDLLMEHLKDPMFEKETYLTMASRGCCYSCTYCSNSYFNKLYNNMKMLRKRNIDDVIAELKQIKVRFPFIKTIQFEDDAFSYIFTREEIKDFADKFKKEIGLDLFVTGISPATFDREKFASLVEAGMSSVRLGIQTGSERTLKCYNRRQTNHQVEDAAGVINEFKDKLRYVQYDIILDNPWENEQDLVDTLLLLYRLPAPFLVCLQSLTFFPGTDLSKRALEDGIITNYQDSYRKHFSKTKSTYINKMFNFVRASKARGYMAELAGQVDGREIPRWKIYIVKNRLLRSIHRCWIENIKPQIRLIKQKVSRHF